jgi:hypothetical protein
MKKNHSSRKSWSRKHDDYLRRWHLKRSLSQIAHTLKRSYSSMEHRARKLGISRPVSEVASPWSKRDDVYLKRWHRRKSFSEIARALGRTPNSVDHRARKLGITNPAALFARTWSTKEDLYLRRWHRKRSLAEIARALKRTTSSVDHRARKLRIAERRATFANPWSSREDAYLTRWHRKKTGAAIADALGRTISSIDHRARSLGIAYSASGPWLPKHDALLRRWYLKRSLRQIARALRRTPRAVANRARKIRIVRSLRRNRTSVRKRMKRGGSRQHVQPVRGHRMRRERRRPRRPHQHIRRYKPRRKAKTVHEHALP